MNRDTRRRCARLARASARHTGHTPGTCAKQTHKLPPQACAIFFPDLSLYLVDMDENPFRLHMVERPELATALLDEDAEATALLIAQATGLRAAVRRFAGRLAEPLPGALAASR